MVDDSPPVVAKKTVKDHGDGFVDQCRTSCSAITHAHSVQLQRRRSIALTSDLLRIVLRLGLNRTSLKSSLRSVSILGIMLATTAIILSLTTKKKKK